MIETAIFFVLGAVACRYGLAFCLNLLGFTAAGIKLGSFAALIHSWIGNVVAGSWFAYFMTIGATGFSAVINAVLAVGSSLLAWIIYI